MTFPSRILPFLVGLLALPSAQAQRLPSTSDFEAPAFDLGSIEGQQGWSLQQGFVEVGEGVGRNGTRGLVIDPSLPFGQASLILDEPSEEPVVFIDLWLRPIASADEGEAQFLDADGAVAAFFRFHEMGWLEVMNGNGQQDGEWVATKTEYPVPESGVSPDWLRLTFRLDFAAENRGWDLYVNGNLEAANLGFWDDNAAGFQRLSLMGHSQAALHVDDVTIGGENPLFTDVDKDGLPDEWENALGLNPDLNDREADPDGDGISAIQAYIDGDRATAWPTLGLSGNVSEANLFDQLILSVPSASIRSGTLAERRALLNVLELYAKKGQPEQVEILEDYLNGNPQSPYALWVGAHAARSSLQGSRFSKALSLLEDLWRTYKDTHEPELQAIIGCVGVDLGSLYALTNRNADLGALVDNLAARPLQADLPARLVDLQQKRWTLESRPDRTGGCGPAALRVLQSLETSVDLIDPSNHRDAVTLTSLATLAATEGINVRMAKREAGIELPVPSVIHWKLGHYSTIVSKESDGSYLVMDPGLASRRLVSTATFDEESSGFLLTAPEEIGLGIREVSDAEGDAVIGKSGVGGQDQNDDAPEPCECDEPGMPTYALDHFRASYYVRDTPFSYTPPRGPVIDFKISYADHTQSPLNSYNYTRLGNGAKWAFNWMSYIDVKGASADRVLFLPNGNKETHVWNSSTFKRHHVSQNGLERVPATGTITGFIKRNADDSYLEFGRSGKETTLPLEDRRWFLTKMVDPYGNAVTINYDTQGRISSVVDAAGVTFTFSYTTSTSYDIWKITDARGTGRNVTFTYDGVPRLASVTDVDGITTTFGYNYWILTSMSNVHGTTSFGTVTWGSGHSWGKYTEVTDPRGYKERVLYANELSGVPIAGGNPSSSTEVPSSSSDPSGLSQKSLYDFGFTLYWDKKAMNDYPPANGAPV